MRNIKLLLIALMLMLGLQGCQTAPVNQSTDDSASEVSDSDSELASSESVEETEVISEESYGFFFDQGDHLRKLTKANKLKEADKLYEKYADSFFKEEAEKQAKDVDALVGAIDARFDARIQSSVSALPSLTIQGDWSNNLIAMNNAKQVKDEYFAYFLIREKGKASSNGNKLLASYQEREEYFKSNGIAAFTNYDHNQGSFFEVYPPVFSDRGLFLSENSILVRNILSDTTPANIAVFKDSYSVDLASESGKTALSAISDLYVEKVIKEKRRKGNKLSATMFAVNVAKKLGFSPANIDAVRVAFVDATSKTLLKEGRIEFPFSINTDLPFELKELSINEIFGKKRNEVDYVVVVEVNLAKSTRRIIKRDKKPSRYLVRIDKEPNPAYEQARMNVFTAQSNKSSADSQYCHGLGCIGKAISQVAAATELNDAQTIFAGTSQFLDNKIYQDYKYSQSNIDAKKTVSVNYYVLDMRAKKMYRSDFDIEEKRGFTVAYNIHDKDEEKEEYLESIDKEETLVKYEDALVDIKLSQILSQYAENPGKAERLPTLSGFKKVILKDKNKALVKYKKTNFEKKVIKDPRFDSIVVVYNPKGSLGTGFYVKPDLILTNYHVVEGVQFVEMRLHNGLESFGKVVKSDVRLDLALVKVQARGTPVNFFNNDIPLGREVTAIGHPSGLEFTLTRGVVSALRKRESVYAVGGDPVLFIQTDTPINPGNSGGPLFLGGKVIGVNNNKFVKTGVEGLSFAIHYSEVQTFMNKEF